MIIKLMVNSEVFILSTTDIDPTAKNSIFDDMSKFVGRKEFLTTLKDSDITDSNVIEIVKYYFELHGQELPVIKALYDFDKGVQPILGKTRDMLASENNKVVLNLARTARKIMQSGFLGEQIQYVYKDEAKNGKEAVKALKDIFDEEDEAEHNVRIENDRGISGVAYEFIGIDDSDKSDLLLKTLSPYCTRVVKSSDISQKPIFAFSYYSLYDTNFSHIGYHLYVYTETNIFEFDVSEGFTLLPYKEVEKTINPTKKIPIVEYINNIERMGDFEPAISILNAINRIFSKRVDNVDDIVDSFLVFVNCSIYDEILDDNGKVIGYDTTRLDAFKKNKTIEIKSSDAGLVADLKKVVTELDQTEVQVLIDSLTQYAFAIMGVPNPINVKATGSSDSSEAVNTNEGWKAFESLLKTKERYFRKSLKQRIKIIKTLRLYDDKLKELIVSKVDIKFIRTKALNSQSNAEALDILRKTGLFTEETIISLSNIVESPASELDKKVKKLQEMVDKGLITEKQKTMVQLASMYPNLQFDTVFGSSSDSSDSTNDGDTNDTNNKNDTNDNDDKNNKNKEVEND